MSSDAAAPKNYWSSSIRQKTKKEAIEKHKTKDIFYSLFLPFSLCCADNKTIKYEVAIPTQTIKPKFLIASVLLSTKTPKDINVVAADTEMAK